MLKPDDFFKGYNINFPTLNRSKARVLFRRALRDYYVMQRKYVINPETNERVSSVFIGETIKQQKKQRRRTKKYFRGHTSAGQPRRLEIKFLIARLFILWGTYASTPATFSWKTNSAIKTDFEDFMFDLLPKIGAKDVRRYVELHWQERK
jgi:hypothetical protein